MPDLLDVLFDDLRDSVRRFNRLLGAGLLFAVVCHFCVVEPYFGDFCWSGGDFQSRQQSGKAYPTLVNATISTHPNGTQGQVFRSSIIRHKIFPGTIQRLADTVKRAEEEVDFAGFDALHIAYIEVG